MIKCVNYIFDGDSYACYENSYRLRYEQAATAKRTHVQSANKLHFKGN